MKRAARAKMQVITHTLRCGLCGRGKPEGFTVPHTLSGSQLVAWNCTLRSCTDCRRLPFFTNVTVHGGGTNPVTKPMGS